MAERTATVDRSSVSEAVQAAIGSGLGVAWQAASAVSDVARSFTK